MKINRELQEKYNEQYHKDLTEWRLTGAKEKARNIMRLAAKDRFSNVLDVGAGDGSVLYWLDKANFCDNMTAAEISESGIQKIKAKAIPSVRDIVRFDGYRLPFDNEQFDLAVCSHVIEHVEFPRTLIREIARVSRVQIFEVPIDFSLRVDKKVDHFLSYGHINVYSPQTFRFLLQSEGMDVQSFYNSMYSRELYAYMNRNKTIKGRLINSIKLAVWQIFPFLRAYKPDATTVRTVKAQRNSGILQPR